jgi:hypothetical protein
VGAFFHGQLGGLRPPVHSANVTQDRLERGVGDLGQRRWNERLSIVRNLEAELEGLTASPATELTPADRERLMTLGADL